VSGERELGRGRGRSKIEAEQSAARDALTTLETSRAD
jgi:dsRNA-specific ribonuclease